MESNNIQDDGIYENSAAESNRVVEVFKNVLIWRRMAMYLNLDDLKAMREVSAWMNYNVITETDGFLEKSVLKLELNGGMMESNTLRSSSCIPWRNMKVILGNDVISANIALSSIFNIADSLETLTLSCNCDCDPKIQSSEWKEFVTRFLQECQKIHTISVEVRLLESILLFTPNTEIAKIQHFRIFTLDKKIRVNYTEVFTQNLEAFATRMTDLNTFGLDDFRTNGRMEDSLALRLRIMNIVAQNCSTLTTLELENSRIWWKNFELPLCPILKNLKVRILFKIGITNLTNFLRNQPELDCLSISTTGTITKELLSVIAYKSGNLRVFNFKAKRLNEIISPAFDGPFRFHLRQPAAPHQENPFTFLKDLIKLEEFSLTIPKGGTAENSVAYIGFNIILENLPMTMEKISLRGLKGNGPIGISGLDLSFPKLSSLYLERCPGIIDNTGLSYLSIRRNDDSYPYPLHELVHLRISHCDGVTGIGLTGISKNCKGMRSLSFQSCKLTDQCAEALKFPELTFIDVSGNSDISSAGIHAIMLNNPSLKKLKCSVDGISIPPGTRLTSIQYKDSQYDDDSDSDATNPRPLQRPPPAPTVALNFGLGHTSSIYNNVFRPRNSGSQFMTARTRNYHRPYTYDDDMNLSSRDCFDSHECD